MCFSVSHCTQIDPINLTSGSVRAVSRLRNSTKIILLLLLLNNKKKMGLFLLSDLILE